MLDVVLDFIKDWRFIIVFIGAMGILVLVDWRNFKEKAYALMLQAERLAKKAILNSGQEQQDWVYEKLKVFMPKTVAILGEKRTRQLIDFLFHKAKDYLDDGQLNNSWVEPEE